MSATELQGYAAERAWVTARVDALWQDATPIAWENLAFDPPKDTPWIRVSVTSDDVRYASMGDNPIHRHDGMVIIEVFTQPHTGTGQSDALCDLAIAMFRGVQEKGVKFLPPPRKQVVGTRNGWYKQDVLCPFIRDTIFTSDDEG